MGKNKWQEKADEFRADCERAVEISRENLHKLMNDNKDTEYGRKYRFDQVENAADYSRLVPLSDYGDYESYVERMRGGEENVLSVYPIKHYIMTSGSTGQSKRIPLSFEALERCTDPNYYVTYAKMPQIDTGKYLHLSVLRMELPKPETDTIISGAFFRFMHDKGGYDLDERYLGGEKLMFSKGVGNVPYVKLWIAFSSPDMRGIQAFFMYDILLFFKFFEDNWESVLSNVRERKIPEDIELDEKVRADLLALPMPDDAWLDSVERECKKGFDGIAKRIWKQLIWVSGVGGSTFFAQEAALRDYLGDVKLHYFTYASSECMIAVTLESESVDNVLIPKAGFFEFIPWSKDEKDVRPRTIEELEVGKEYEIIITNFSGLYRYRLNDVVKVTGFYGQSPVLRVCFRKNQAINIAGEKTDLQTLAMAIEEMSLRFGFRIYEYSVYDDKTLLPGRYQCFIEAEGDVPPESELSSALDEILKELNEDYMDLRGLGMIGEASVYQVMRGTHSACKKQFQQKQAQNKPLQYLIDPQIIEFMRERII